MAAREEAMKVMISFSAPFMTTDVSAMGRKSFKQLGWGFLGTGTIIVFLKHVGIMHLDGERLKNYCEG